MGYLWNFCRSPSRSRSPLPSVSAISHCFYAICLYLEWTAGKLFVVSAHDRATTIVALASKESKPEDFNRPGHIFPLKYREGGVLKRAGHTEASFDLAVLAGLDPVAVLCEIVDDDGSMARLPMLKQFVQSHNMKIISIAELIRNARVKVQKNRVLNLHQDPDLVYHLARNARVKAQKS